MTAGNAAIPRHALLACEPFSPRLGAGGVAAALSAGLTAAGAPEPDSLELPGDADYRATAALLERGHFHRRMHAARAVVIAVPSLAEQTLAGSAAFEIATLARQSGRAVLRGRGNGRAERVRPAHPRPAAGAEGARGGDAAGGRGTPG